MIANTSQIRSRIDELRLSLEGYTRQLAHGTASADRTQDLEWDVAALRAQIDSLERLAQVIRVMPDPEEIVTQVLRRVEDLRGMGPAPEVEGEIRALEWVVGEDTLAHEARAWAAGLPRSAASHEAALSATLLRVLNSGRTVEQRAIAAHDLGRLGLVQAIPALVEALGDEPLVREMAQAALKRFSTEQLRAASLSPEDAAVLGIGSDTAE